MKKVINGKLYNTESAEMVGHDSANWGNFSFWAESLYKKRTGEFFLYGEGGPMSRYARSCGNNSVSGGESIKPLSEAEAREWAEEHLDGDEYIEIFGDVEE